MRHLFIVALSLVAVACGGSATPAVAPLPSATVISNSDSPFDGAQIALPVTWVGAAGSSEGALTVALLSATTEATGYRSELRPFGFLEGDDIAGVYAATALDGSGFLSIEAYPIDGTTAAGMRLETALVERIAGGPANELRLEDGAVAGGTTTVASFFAYELPWAVSVVDIAAYRYLIVASTRDDAALLVALLRDLRLAE